MKAWRRGYAAERVQALTRPWAGTPAGRHCSNTTRAKSVNDRGPPTPAT
ncbi:hypothetical protein ACIRVF_20040 [Kitasatospora sp. NPDC101157]